MPQPHHPDPATPRQLVDSHGRRLHYLRLSVTDLCNQRCVYCMPPGGVTKLPRHEVLSLEELARVARAAVGLGVDKIRLTGGEPLLRRNLEQLLESIHNLSPRPDLRLTTNGRYLARRAAMLARRGVSTVNVSLDTLRPERFGVIAGLAEGQGPRALSDVLAGLDAALAEGLAVKLNVVLLRGLNDDELLDFARLSLARPIAVRFIEYMPVGRKLPFAPQRFLSAEEAQVQLTELGELTPLPTRPGDGPARRLKAPGAAGELGFISAISSHFCQACNRLRVSAEGGLVPCLFSDEAIDLKPVLRGDGGQEALEQAFLEAARRKPASHHQQAEAASAAGGPMFRLGG